MKAPIAHVTRRIVSVDTRHEIEVERGWTECDEPDDTAVVWSNAAGRIVATVFTDAMGNVTRTSGSTAIATGSTRSAANATVSIAWRIAARVRRARLVAASASISITVAFSAARTRMCMAIGDRC